MKRPENATSYEAIDLKLGIKSSLPAPRATLALLILLWEVSGKPGTLEYAMESENKLVLKHELKEALEEKLNDVAPNVSSDLLDQALGSNNLLKSQLESLIVAFELVWKVARIRFSAGKSNSAERTGQKRYSKTLWFTHNMDLLDIVIDDSEDCYRTLFAWMGLPTTPDATADDKLVRCLNIFAEEAFFKLVDRDVDVIFNLESLYQALLEEDAEIDVYGDGEEKGSLRILHSALSDNLFEYMVRNGHSVTVRNAAALSEYYQRVQTYHKLSSTAQVVQVNKSNEAEEIGDVGTNILLYGVPGCGKSYTIKTEYCNDENRMERVVFHPDYTYSDFIGQIMPTNEDGHISYPFLPGPFTRILQKAVADPNNKYYLIIEELNRGNAPAIFGEIFQLLDRKNGESEYGITNPDIAREVYKDPAAFVKIPANLFILATMNTADQNVFTLDTAFKRRWNMVCVENSFDDCDFADEPICDSQVSWRTFATRINAKIIEYGENNIGSEDNRLGAFFVNANEIKNQAQFAEKVLMYLWNDAFKFEHTRVFKPEYKTLEKLIKGFKEIGFDIFSEDMGF